MTRDELAEQEFTEAFEELKRDAARYEAGETRAVDAPPRISDFLPPANIHPSNLPIKRLRCRDRFDYAFACQGFGGQFLHNYRYASLPRDCSEVWSEFWFCMRNKARSEEIQERMYRERRVQKDEERYGVGKRSSEDVWAMRMMPVKGSFDGDYEADLAAWREQDEEGKKRIAVM